MHKSDHAAYGEKARILITGATGFVGRSLVPALIGRGYALSLICRGSSDVPDEWHGDPLIRLFRVPELADGAPLVAFKNVESVVHLAGLAHIGKANRSNLSQEIHRANAVTTQRLTAVASVAGVRKFIHLSSMAVVGGNTSNVTIDDQSPLQPQTDYGRSKLEAERSAAGLCKKGIFSVSLRPPLIIGAAAKGNWRSLQKLAVTGLPLPFASIATRRSFIGIAMLVEAIEHLIANEWEIELSGEYCVAASPPLSLPTIIAALREGMGLPRRLFACPPELFSLIGTMTGRRRQISGLIGELTIDAQRFNTNFGFQPSADLLEEIKDSGAQFVG